ncbi:2-polyprenyl-6-methoxyphenol hydroxylase [Halobiforma haloterrestris]|uniref:2-polyprenyl-6-methoxyphenol hydroxylase n=2 Tax=Natronobacterium haloterrestre TaxID=148448 RepID=A0A1I1J411_NATHA|nr:2-polyprenyl-6-methoxyphenol hydroxylase [Halobiforma haloterrestris]
MTLETVSRYNPARVSESDEHAVVIGGSMAGLLTARVLADGFEAVTIIERDSLSDQLRTRKGVPQADHPHALLEAGRATLEDLFPGYGEDLISAGGLVIDALTDFRHYENGDFLADGSTRLPMYAASRPLFELITRRRLSDLDGIHIRSNCQWLDYLVDDATTSVDGVVVRTDDGTREEIAADLTVDATGRTSRTPTWLEEHGYEAPSVEEVRIDIAYSTALFERPPDDRRTFFVPASAPRTRGGAVFPVEADRWLVNMHGVHGDHPPTDFEGFAEFAGTLPVPDLKRLVDTQPWIGEEIDHYPFPSNRRYRYAKLDRFPSGLVVIGDAITSFNPIYGQGMSVAALEALVLHHVLAAGDRTNIALPFFERAEEVIDIAWNMAVGSDFGFPQTTGPKPRGTDFFNRYLSRLTSKAHTDAGLREAFYRVITMEVPPTTLLRPGIVWRVFKPSPSDIGTGFRSRSQRQSKRTS